ncbi:MAG: hypothetical protein NVS2B9_11960 [Myxococcales bacterium]
MALPAGRLNANDEGMPETSKPWERKRPTKNPPKKLTPAQKKEARASALRAGRKYPNLIDNMRVAAKSKK